MTKTRKALLNSILSLVLCFAMLLGTTYAWFTDSVTSTGNIIKSGVLDLEMYWTDNLDDPNWKDASEGSIFNYEYWEPGYTDVKYIKIANEGNLAFRYALNIIPDGAVTMLADVIDVYCSENPPENLSGRGALPDKALVGTLTKVINGTTTGTGTLLPKSGENSGEIVLAIAMKMREEAGNEYQNLSLSANPQGHPTSFAVRLMATQYTYESDSFDDQYDADSQWPGMGLPGGDVSASAPVTVNEDGAVTEEVTLAQGEVSAIVPVGVLVTGNELTLSVTEKANSDSNVNVEAHEALMALDVHIEGVSANNTMPIIVKLGKVLPVGLNMGNLSLYHVENGSTNCMEQVNAETDLDKHNEFYYDPATGNLTVAMATFSEVAVVADTKNAWNGEYDYTWYYADATELTIANADQLAAFGAIVGGMNGQTQDSFSGKTVKLNADINLGGKDNDNASLIFYPIGYYNSTGSYEKVSGGSVTSDVNSFEGTFDGNGHTISNFYQNTWEMFGDYNSGYSDTPNHYKDAMGLFGYVLNGTVKNLTVDNFSSDGEFTPTGVIAAYAVNSTFENIAITNCNPRVYNTGNGGIVGIGGDSSDTKDSKLIFKNITIDHTNKISALWGSWDVACGGLMGMFFGPDDVANASRIEMTNCHVAAQIDVNNDVCGNYQYYWYRYSGMMVGTIDYHKTENGYTVPDTSMITAKDCTVHFGDWNDYYYCELVANSLASYTHDHQFSRLEVIDSLKDIQDENGNWNRTGNFLLFGENGKQKVSGEGTCYHIMKDTSGNLYEHKHDVADSTNKEIYETVNGNEVLKENNQRIYLPFNQLFTGYGWGVKNIPVYNGEDYAFEGITILDRVGEGNEKFKVLDTITSKKFLFRVGNGNAFPIGKLFEALYEQNDSTKDKYLIRPSGVYVSVSSMTEGNIITGTFTRKDDWTQSTLKIDGTGLAKITIQDYNYCTPTVLYLEVVDGYNVTAYSELKNRNSVLLNDITMSSGSSYYLSGATLYGNSFTFDMTDGTYAAGGNTSSNYVFGLDNAHLDNVKIVGAVYTTYGATVQSEYNRAAVLSTGNNTITNCYVSNCASAVRVKDGNLEIVNSTIKGGNFANIDIRGGHVILDNVTTINQVKGNDTAKDGTVVVGLGVVIYYENVLNTTTVEIKNGITQYNYLSKTQAATYIKDTTANKLVSVMFNSDYSNVQYSDGSDTWVNAGILSMTSDVGDDNITDVDGYVDASPSMMSVTGYLHTKQPDAASIAVTAPEYTTAGQGAIAPSYSFDYTTKNYVAKTDGSNDYCYEENGTVNISMDAGDTFNWDTSILTATKNGQTLDYTVSMNGTDYTGKSIAFNTAGTYEVVYTYTDSNNYGVDAKGNITTYSKTYTKTVHISVAVIEASAKNAEFTMGSSKAATEKITIDNVTYVSATGVTADNSTWTYITINGQKIYYPIVAAKLTSTKGSSTYAYFPVFENVVTITDYADNGTGDAFNYNSSTTTLPSTLTAVKGIYKAASDVPYWYNLTNSNLTQSGASNIFKWASSSAAPSDPTTYNKVLCYKSPEVSTNRVAYITLVQYSYTDATNTTYYYYVGYTLEAFTYQACVTADTLVTLADGSQKRIDEVTYADQLLAWDFYKGEFTTVSSAIIFDHGADNNTVIELKFSDGTAVKVVNLHQFFDADLGEFVSVDADHVADFVGHRFAKQSGNGCEMVTLVDYTVSHEYTEAWGIISTAQYNILVEGMISTDFMLEDYDLFNYFEIGANMKFDAEKMQADIEKYGLYTYEDFADYLTYEQFVAFNVQYFKIAVGKGTYTFEGILELIDTYLNH